MQEKNWWRVHKDRIRSAAIAVAVTGTALSAAAGVNLYQNRKATEAMIAARAEEAARMENGGPGNGPWSAPDGPDGSDRGPETGDRTGNDTGSASDGDLSPDTGNAAVPADRNLAPVLAADQLEYQGKQYRRNHHVKAVLCMGVDRKDTMTETKELGEAGQADGLFLIAQDTARNTLKILMIPRDTMTEITFSSQDRSRSWKGITQLTMAFAYGDGKEESCEHVVEAVEGLLSGFRIDHYLAADIAVIDRLNDAVGGVTVTVPTAGMEKRDPAFVQGKTVTLHGGQAEAFVRYRDTGEDYSALYRMDRQQEYITQYFQAVRKKSKEDSRTVSHLFELAQDHMVTDMGKETYLKIAMDALQTGGLDRKDFYTAPGTGMTTETFDIYRADREALIPIVLELFYREA